MGSQQYFTGFRLNSSVVLQTRFVKFVVLGSVCTLVVTAVVVALYLTGHVYVLSTILPYTMGHAHTATSAAQRIVEEGPSDGPNVLRL
ncbi:MAG: hypothetical protein ABI234_07135 [Ktedonobacteraceae bacterium]